GAVVNSGGSPGPPPEPRPPEAVTVTPSPPSRAALRLETLPGDVARVTFDLPGSRANTLGQAVLAEFEQLLPQLERPGWRGLVLRSGKPGMFVAGADLRELGTARPDPAVTRALTQRGLTIIGRFEALPYPTVAAIEGA